MIPAVDPTPRERLLAAVLAHVDREGVGDSSLRALAAAVGSSHRMLSYHFGSRDGLLVEIARAVERQQREAFVAMVSDPHTSPGEVMWTMYERFVDPSLRSQERLFFELYARALRNPAQSHGFLPEVVEAWVPPLEQLFARLGLDPAQAAHEARLALAVSRGLLLDLLATEDRVAIDAAAARFISRYDEGLTPST